MSSPSAAAGASTNKWLAICGVGTGLFMSTLDSSIVNVSLPTLVNELNTSFALIQWMTLSYLLVVTALMPASARLGDIAGRKTIYIGGLAIFTLGSLCCGLAPSIGWLIVFRGLQGIGGVMIEALAVALAIDIFPENERGLALGINALIVSIGISTGPVIGGLLIGLVGWRSIFLINVPVGIISVFIVQWLVKPIPRLAGEKFDALGGLIIFVALLTYLLGMTLGQERGFAMPVPILLIGAGMAGLALFIQVEKRIAQPIVDLALFRHPVFSLNLLNRFIIFVVMTTTNLLLPFFLELVQQRPIEQIGLMMMAIPVCMGIMAPLSGILSDRFGTRGISIIGQSLVVGGALLTASLTAESTVLTYLVSLAPIGLGLGLFHSPNNSAIMGVTPAERRGVVSGLMAIARTLAQTSGFPLMGAIFYAQATLSAGLPMGTAIQSIPIEALTHGFRISYLVTAAAVALTVLISIVAVGISRKLPRATGPSTQCAEGSTD